MPIYNWTNNNLIFFKHHLDVYLLYNYIVLSTTDMLIIGDWWSVIILGDWWKCSEFLVIGELTNLILVIGESWGVYTPPPHAIIAYFGYRQVLQS